MKIIYEYNDTNSSGFQTADGALTLEIFNQFDYATGAGASTDALVVASSSNFSVGDSIYVGTNAAQTIVAVPSSTTITLTTAIIWANNDAVVVKRETGQMQDDYASLFDDTNMTTSLTQPLTDSTTSNKWRFYINGDRYAVRVSNSSGTTRQIDNDIVLNPYREDSVTQSITDTSTTLTSTHPILEITTDQSRTPANTPIIANGYNNQILHIVNVGSNDLVLTDDTGASGSGLRLVATPTTLNQFDNITLMYNNTLGEWIELSSANNLPT